MTIKTTIITEVFLDCIYRRQKLFDLRFIIIWKVFEMSDVVGSSKVVSSDEWPQAGGLLSFDHPLNEGCRHHSITVRVQKQQRPVRFLAKHVISRPRPKFRKSIPICVEPCCNFSGFLKTFGKAFAPVHSVDEIVVQDCAERSKESLFVRNGRS